MKNILISLLSAIVILLLAAAVLTHFYVNGERIAGYLSDKLGDEFIVDVPEASFNLFTLSLDVNHAEVKRISGQDEEEQLLYLKHAGISGLSLMGALRGEFSTRRIILMDFYLNGEALQRGFETERLDLPTGFDIGSVELVDGTMTLSGKGGGNGEIHHLNLSAGPFKYPSGCVECDLWAGLEELEIEIPSLTWSTENSHYTIRGKNLLFHALNEEISAEQISFEPNYEDDEFLELLEFRTEYADFSFSDLNIRNFNFVALRDRGEMIAESAEMGALNLHITLDKRLPEDPDRGEAVMPAEALNNIPFRVVLDTFRIRNADVYYSEYASDGVRPGTVFFGETSAMLTDIDNRSDQTALLRIHSFLEGTGELNTEFRLPLGDNPVISEVRGSLGNFDIPVLNNMFMDLEGLRFEEGVVHGLEFEYIMYEDHSEGFVDIDYQDLRVSVIDKAAHDQSLADSVRSLFTDQIVIRASSERRGEIFQEKEEEKSFFNYLWTSLRSGIFDVVQRI